MKIITYCAVIPKERRSQSGAKLSNVWFLGYYDGQSFRIMPLSMYLTTYVGRPILIEKVPGFHHPKHCISGNTPGRTMCLMSWISEKDISLWRSSRWSLVLFKTQKTALGRRFQYAGNNWTAVFCTLSWFLFFKITLSKHDFCWWRRLFFELHRSSSPNTNPPSSKPQFVPDFDAPRIAWWPQTRDPQMRLTPLWRSPLMAWPSGRASARLDMFRWNLLGSTWHRKWVAKSCHELDFPRFWTMWTWLVPPVSFRICYQFEMAGSNLYQDDVSPSFNDDLVFELSLAKTSNSNERQDDNEATWEVGSDVVVFWTSVGWWIHPQFT